MLPSVDCGSVGDRPYLAGSPYCRLPRRRSSGKARRRRLVLALPDVLRCGSPARRRRNPAPQPREARTRAATRKAGKALTRGVKIAAAHGPRPEGADAAPRLGGGTPQRGGAATPGGPSRGRAAPAQAEPQAGQRGAAGRGQARPGRRAAPPQKPPRVGAGRPGAPTPQPARGWRGARPAKRPPKGAWPCGPTGWPRATAGGWQAPKGRRPEPPKAATSRHNSPTATGGRGGRRPSRPGWAGVAARRPRGAGGTRPEGADGSPLSPALPSAAPSRGAACGEGWAEARAVYGPPAGPRPDRGRNEAEAGREGRGPPECAAARRIRAQRAQKARPSGRAICHYRPAGQLTSGHRPAPAPAGQSPIYRTTSASRGDNTGAAAPVPQRGLCLIP